MRAAQEIETGGVIINDTSLYRADAMPYGGVKRSGTGKEGPKYVIEEMTEERIVVLSLQIPYYWQLAAPSVQVLIY